VLLNTAGGLTDGDEVDVSARWHEGSHAVITTQAAERLYRARSGAANVVTRLDVLDDATAAWIPQETIMFDAGRMRRRIRVDLRETSRLLAAESLVLGRTAMGEVVRTGLLDDSWQVSIDGSIIFVDRMRISSDEGETIDEQTRRRAVMNGAASLATLIVVSRDCGLYVDRLRAAILEAPVTGGVSDLGPLLVVRLLATTGQAMRSGIMRLVDVVGQSWDLPLPRVWKC
jgi:urease accessory protein